MSELTPDELKAASDSRFPNNDSGLITAQQIREQDTDIVDSLLSFQDLAWGNYQDLTYDSESPLVIDSLVIPEYYQVDKQQLKKEFRPKSVTEELWNSSEDKIVIPEIDRDVEIYVYFKGTADQNNRNLFVELYIPVTDIVIEGNPIPFPRNTESRHVEYFSGTTTQEMVDNGLQIRLYSDGVINLYDMGIRIKLGKKANIT
jgi:hypothetical protein